MTEDVGPPINRYDSSRGYLSVERTEEEFERVTEAEEDLLGSFDDDFDAEDTAEVVRRDNCIGLLRL